MARVITPEYVESLLPQGEPENPAEAEAKIDQVVRDSESHRPDMPQEHQ